MILVHASAESTQVYDLDTTLSFPASFQDYCESTFGSEDQLKECYHRKFRVVPAERYLATFASDRRHMKNSEGEWLQPPPPWSCIKIETTVHNLESFIDMTEGLGEGGVFSLEGFISYYSNKERRLAREVITDT